MSDEAQDVVNDNIEEHNDTESPEKETTEKLFTQAELDEVLTKRLARERKKFDEELKQTKSSTQGDKSELEQLREQLESLQQENETNKVTALKNRVSRETGVPVELLTATAEDDIVAQAENITKYVESKATKSTKTDAQKPGQPLKEGTAPATQSREDILAQVMGRK